jgi:tetratricopeptide (TPR) repeat protein
LLEEMADVILAKPASSTSPKQLKAVESAAVQLWQQKRLDKSIPIFEEVLRRRILLQGADHFETLGAKGNLGINYKDASRFQDAVRLLEECLQGAKKYPALKSVQPHLLHAYALSGENAKAALLLKEELPDARKRLPADSMQLADMLALIGMGLSERKDWAEAEQHLRECLRIRESRGSDDYKTDSVKSLLGGALLGQKQYADAKPLLLAGYEGMMAHQSSMPPQAAVLIPQAIDRLIELYTATNKPDEVKKWRAERAKYPTPKEVAPPPQKK